VCRSVPSDPKSGRGSGGSPRTSSGRSSQKPSPEVLGHTSLRGAIEITNETQAEGSRTEPGETRGASCQIPASRGFTQTGLLANGYCQPGGDRPCDGFAPFRAVIRFPNNYRAHEKWLLIPTGPFFANGGKLAAILSLSYIGNWWPVATAIPIMESHEQLVRLRALRQEERSERRRPRSNSSVLSAGNLPFPSSA
jgi:hypothetical protein